MSSGQVKWFNNTKGFGFILPDEGGDDLFAHYSAIGMDGYKTLKAGQRVSYDAAEGPKGLHAINIKPLDDGPEPERIRVAPPIDSGADSGHDGDRRDDADGEIDAGLPAGGIGDAGVGDGG